MRKTVLFIVFVIFALIAAVTLGSTVFFAQTRRLHVSHVLIRQGKGGAQRAGVGVQASGMSCGDRGTEGACESAQPSLRFQPMAKEMFSLQRSLFDIVDSHRRDASTKIANPELFELETIITPEEYAAKAIGPKSAFSSFGSLTDDLQYAKVDEWFQPGPTRNMNVGIVPFVLVRCGGTPDPRCNSPTTLPEPQEFHLPLQNWTMDLNGIAAIIKAEGFSSSGSIIIRITTLGRAQHVDGRLPTIAILSSSAFSALPLTVPVILVSGPSRTEKNLSSTGPYMVLDGRSGALLDAGKYKLPRSPQ
jgi:hypothetical protein